MVLEFISLLLLCKYGIHSYSYHFRPISFWFSCYSILVQSIDRLIDRSVGLPSETFIPLGGILFFPSHHSPGLLALQGLWVPCGGGGCDGADLHRLAIVPFVRGQYECSTVIFVNTSHSSGMKTLQLGKHCCVGGNKLPSPAMVVVCVSSCVPIYPPNYLYIRVSGTRHD